ncbi:MAG: hypothetical protein RIS09_337 [Actinomycetota bacterium]|jgi:hypothetical protein
MAASAKIPYTNEQVESVPASLALEGNCRNAKNPEIFFGETKKEIAEAKKYCVSCPVLTMCIAYALKNEEYGVWGGTSARERETMNGKKIVSPEIRRDAAALREEIKKGELKVREIARKHDVDERTVYRYKKKMREEGLLK